MAICEGSNGVCSGDLVPVSFDGTASTTFQVFFLFLIVQFVCLGDLFCWGNKIEFFFSNFKKGRNENLKIQIISFEGAV